MSEYKDKNDKVWKVEMDGFSVEPIEKSTGYDILDPSGEGLVQISTRGDLLTMALWVLCEDQRGDMTQRDFARTLGKSEVVEAAGQALREAVLDFFPPSQKQAVFDVIVSLLDLNEKRMELMLENVSPEKKGEVLEAMRMGMTKFRKKAIERLKTIQSESSASALPDTSDVAPVE